MGRQAILDAVANVAHWVVNENFTNVLLEISNEFAHRGYRNWRDGEWLKSVDGQVELILHAKKSEPNLLVSTSAMGDGTVPEPIGSAADFILIHLNTTPLQLIPEKILQARRYGKPVLCNEDDKIGRTGAEAARLTIISGAGWGFMHSEKNQHFPFEFDGPEDDTLVYQMFSRLTEPGQSDEDIPTVQLSPLMTHPKDWRFFFQNSFTVPAGSRYRN